MRHVEEDLLRPVRRALSQRSDTGEEACLAYEPAGRGVVGVPIGPVRCQDDPRPEPSDGRNQDVAMRRVPRLTAAITWRPTSVSGV